MEVKTKKSKSTCYCSAQLDNFFARGKRQQRTEKKRGPKKWQLFNFHSILHFRPFLLNESVAAITLDDFMVADQSAIFIIFKNIIVILTYCGYKI
jgi:hypothetical protein